MAKVELWEFAWVVHVYDLLVTIADRVVNWPVQRPVGGPSRCGGIGFDTFVNAYPRAFSHWPR